MFKYYFRSVVLFPLLLIMFFVFQTQKQAPEPLIYFDKGRVGVNFFGFKAAAGLGSILTGNQADGGLYAEAGTPFGQFAHAGLGGQVDEQGNNKLFLLVLKLTYICLH